MSKVKVTPNGDGSFITVSKKNSEYGHIRVVQDRFLHDERGFVRRKPITALIVGTIADLKARLEDGNFGGKIIFKESLTPFNEKEPARDYKIAGKTGIVCVQDGNPIYRKTFYVEDVNISDESVAHTNGEEIKTAYAKIEKEEGVDLSKI